MIESTESTCPLISTEPDRLAKWIIVTIVAGAVVLVLFLIIVILAVSISVHCGFNIVQWNLLQVHTLGTRTCAHLREVSLTYTEGVL